MANNPFENIATSDEETQQIGEVAADTVTLLDKRYPSPEKILRGVHPKSHSCVKAIFEVLPNIDESLQVGLFAKPGKRYNALIRFSNAAVHVAHDLENGENGSRGMAIKVLNVGRRTLLDDKGQANQDFLMINTPSFAFANTKDYHRLTKVLLAHNDDPSMFFAPLQVDVPGITDEDKQRVIQSFGVVQQIKAKPVANPLEIQYFGAAPFLFGADRVMKFTIEPKGGEKPQVVPANASENYLNEALLKRMCRRGAVVFSFKVQVRGKDANNLDIENATTAWDEQETPFVTVAQITIPAPQRSINIPRALAACEALVFTPWHALPEHQPLGSINRLRKEVYLASENHREADAGRTGGGRGRRIGNDAERQGRRRGGRTAGAGTAGRRLRGRRTRGR